MMDLEIVFYLRTSSFIEIYSIQYDISFLISKLVCSIVFLLKNVKL